MKALSDALVALLSTDKFSMADLYTITTQAGTVYNWTSADTDLNYSSTTWTAAGDNGTQPLIERGGIRNAAGLEVDTLDLTLYGGQTATVGGARLGLFSASGGFDSARVKVQRAFMATWGDTSAGTVTLFEGNVAGVDPGASKAVLHVKSDLEKLSISMPRTILSPTCNNVFGDTGCGKSVSSLTVTKTVTSGSTISSLSGASGQADDYYANGWIIFTSGVNNGIRRSVNTYKSGVLVPAYPFPSTPAVGDTFSVTPGCSRTKTGCTAWSNLAHFRGFPYVPVTETAY